MRRFKALIPLLCIGTLVFFLILPKTGFAFNPNWSDIEARPRKEVVEVGENFNVELYVRLNSIVEVSGVEVRNLTFSSDKVNVLEVKEGDIFQDSGGFVRFSGGEIGESKIKNIVGIGEELTSSSGSFAVVKFQAKEEGKVHIGIGDPGLSAGASPNPPKVNGIDGKVKIVSKQVSVGGKEIAISQSEPLVLTSDYETRSNLTFSTGSSIIIQTNITVPSSKLNEVVLSIQRPDGDVFKHKMQRVKWEGNTSTYESKYEIPENTTIGSREVNVSSNLLNRSITKQTSFEVSEPEPKTKEPESMTLWQRLKEIFGSLRFW